MHANKIETVAPKLQIEQATELTFEKGLALECRRLALARKIWHIA